MAGQREEYKAGGVRRLEHSVYGLVDRAYPIRFKDFIKVRICGWLLRFSDISLSSLISDSRFLLVRQIRLCATRMRC